MLPLIFLFIIATYSPFLLLLAFLDTFHLHPFPFSDSLAPVVVELVLSLS